MMIRSILAATVVPTLLAFAACGDGSSVPADDAPAAGSSAGELSTIELEQGIGPVRNLDLGPLDPNLAAEGETLFTTKCSACHKLDERYVAPPLGDVLSRRSPEFVMNMMLNAGEMVERHPAVREMLAEYYTPMPVQITEREAARAILEYLRSAATEGAVPDGGS